MCEELASFKDNKGNFSAVSKFGSLTYAGPWEMRKRF